MVEQSVERHGRNIIVPPSPLMLKEALSIDTRVKYFSSERYNINKPHYDIKVSINDWLSTAHYSSYRLGSTFYCALVLALSQELWTKYPRPSDILIRGRAVSIGETFNANHVPGGKIKGIRDVVATGSENWKAASDLGYLSPPRTSSPEMHDSFAGSYAYSHTEFVRESAPSEYKHLIHPLVLVKDGFDGKLTDFYILDNLRLQQ